MLAQIFVSEQANLIRLKAQSRSQYSKLIQAHILSRPFKTLSNMSHAASLVDKMPTSKKPELYHRYRKRGFSLLGGCKFVLRGLNFKQSSSSDKVPLTEHNFFEASFEFWRTETVERSCWPFNEQCILDKCVKRYYSPRRLEKSTLEGLPIFSNSNKRK